MKKILCSIICILIFNSCWKDEPTQVESEKIDFFVDVTTWSEFNGWSTISKVWQVRSSQDIALSSTTNGRVSSVLVKPWDSVYAGQVLARLSDSFWNLTTGIERASNNIERAKINYDSSALSLDKQIFDAEINLEKLKRSLEIAKKDSEQNILQARDTFSNSQYDGLDSKAALQIEQLDNNIEKAKLDYENKLIADEQTLEWFEVSLKKDAGNIKIFLNDVIEFSDRILWVTERNKSENDRFDSFLWAKDLPQKSLSKQKLRELITLFESQKFSDAENMIDSWNISQEQLIELIDFINSGYDLADDVLSNLETTLNSSIESVWLLGEIEISAFVSQINGYQSQLQGAYWAFISFGSNVKSFIKTYENSQKSLLTSIELQEKDRDIQLKTLRSGELWASTSLERTLLGIEDTIANLEEQVKTAENNLENAKRNKDISLRSLNNAIREANIGYSSAARDISKLTITSPINGTVSEVSLDVGQEVFSNTPLFNIVSDSTPELEISLSKDEIWFVEIWQQVRVMSGQDEIIGTVYSISDIADRNLNYKTTIVFDAGTNIIGNIVDVEITIDTGKMLIPLNIIEVQNDDIGLVKTLSWSTFSDVRVRMWEVFWKYVEIVSCAQQCESLKIITNDVSNFDENKFKILEK